MAVNPEVRRLAREIEDIKRRLRQLKQPTLGLSSIEGGALQIVDEDGVVRGSVGQQEDGTYTQIDVNGPPPGQPATPIVQGRAGAIVVASFGALDEGQNLPADFLRFDIHLGDPGFTRNLATMVGQFGPFGGQQTFALDVGTYEVLLVAVNTSGVESEESVRVSATVTESVEVTEPPAESPILSTSGSKDAITLVAHGVIAPSTILDYYMDGVLIESTRSSVFVVREDSVGGPLVEDTNYEFYVQARNDIPPNPAASPTVIGSLNPAVDTETILAVVSAGFILAGTVQVGNIRISPGLGEPGDVDYDPGGIVIPLSSGGEIRFPADGSSAVIEAILRTRDLTVDGGLIINGITNFLNGKVFLASGTPNPTQQMGMDYTSYSKDIRFLGTANTAQQGRSIAKTANGLYWATIQFLPTGGEKKLLIIDTTTNAIVASVHSDDAVLDFHSVCCVGNTIVALGQRFNSTNGNSEWRTHRYDTSGTFLDGHFLNDQNGDRLTPAISFTDGALAADPDGTHIWVARTQSNGRFGLYQYLSNGSNPTDRGATPTDTGSEFLSGGFYVGSADFGAVRFVLQGIAYGTNATFVFQDPGGSTQGRTFTHDSAKDWSGRPAGMYWDGTRFLVLNADSAGLYLSKLLTHTSDTTIYGQYTWYDNNATGGNKESAPSPIASRVIPKRMIPFLTVPSPPNSGTGDDTANAVRVYVDTDTTTKLYTTITTGQAATITGTIGLSGTGAAPPATTTFTASSATGEIASADGVLISLKGDGSGSAGPYRWKADGRARNFLLLRSTTTSQNLGTTTAWAKLDLTATPLIANDITVVSSVATITQDGYYEIQWGTRFATGNVAGYYTSAAESYSGTDPGVGLGTFLGLFEGRPGSAGSGAPTANGTATQWLADGDKVRVIVRHNTGNAITIDNNPILSYLNLRKVG